MDTLTPQSDNEVSNNYRISDDSGFMGLCDPDSYVSFVSEDLISYEDFVGHFIEEMRKGSLILWNTGLENRWTVEVATSPVKQKFFREFKSSIMSTKGRLLLVNYEVLTDFATSPNKTLPPKYLAQLEFPVAAGTYFCRVLQLVDPASKEPFEDRVHFCIELLKSNDPFVLNSVESVYWDPLST